MRNLFVLVSWLLFEVKSVLRVMIMFRVIVLVSIGMVLVVFDYLYFFMSWLLE